MKEIVIAVLLSAFVWPGAGQIYNREYKKGIALIALTFLFALSLMMGLGMAIAREMPLNFSLADTGVVETLRDRVLADNAGFLLTFQLLSMATWLYAVVDAYMGARDRKKGPAPRPTDADEA